VKENKKLTEQPDEDNFETMS